MQLMSELRGSDLLKDAAKSPQREGTAHSRGAGAVRHRETKDGKVTTYMSPKDLAASHLLTEMNELVHKQRVDQAAQYLTYLNTKAVKRRKLLEATLYLSTAAKRLGPGPHPQVPALLRDRSDLDLPAVEVLRRALEVQMDIKESMRRPPGSNAVQLAQRVEQFKYALLKGVIVDADFALSITLREIAEMEKQLLLANTDLLGLTESIAHTAKKFMGPSQNP